MFRQTDPFHNTRERVLQDVESRRWAEAEPDQEEDRTREDWIEMIRQQAGAALAAESRETEYAAWIELATLAAGRAEQITNLSEGNIINVFEAPAGS